jgi:hypothetical protein
MDAVVVGEGQCYGSEKRRVGSRLLWCMPWVRRRYPFLPPTPFMYPLIGFDRTLCTRPHCVRGWEEKESARALHHCPK